MRALVRVTGAVFPGGTGAPALLDAVRANEPRLQPSRHLPGALAAELEPNLKSLVPRRGLISLSRAALLVAAAIENLRAESADAIRESRNDDCALVVGTAYGHVESKAEFHRSARQDGVGLVSPIVFPNTIINSLAGHAAILYRLTGPNSTVTSGHRSGLEAVLRAMTLLHAGRVERALAIGCEEVSPTLLRAVGSTQGPLGEGAAALLLELPAEAVSGGDSPSSAGRILGSAERSSVACGLERATAAVIGEALGEAGVATDQVRCLITGVEVDAVPAGKAAVGAAGLGNTPHLCLGKIFGDTGGAEGALAVVLACARRRGRWHAGPALILCWDPEGAMAVVVD